MKPKVLILDAIGRETGIRELEDIVHILGKEANKFDLIEHDIHVSPLNEEQLTVADKVIISGGPFSVYDDIPWFKHLEQAITILLKYHKSTLAICLGAQFLAQFLGSKVCKNPAGTEFGSICVSLTDQGKAHQLFAKLHQSTWLHASHNDYIESLPAGAELLAYNENSPVQAFQYDSIIATQFHPDVPVHIMRHLLAGRKERYLASGFLKSDKHYHQIHDELAHGAEGHEVLRKFLIS